jgi:hypothetical protein
MFLKLADWSRMDSQGRTKRITAVFAVKLGFDFFGRITPGHCSEAIAIETPNS